MKKMQQRLSMLIIFAVCVGILAAGAPAQAEDAGVSRVTFAGETLSLGQVITAVSLDASAYALTADGTGITLNQAALADLTMADGSTVTVCAVGTAAPSDLLVGATQQLTAEIPAGAAGQVTTRWTSADYAVAAVSNGGMVTAVGPGSARIELVIAAGETSASHAYSFAITQPVTGVTLPQSAMSIHVGATEVLTAEIVPANASHPEVSWTSANPAVATVSPAGQVTGVSRGDTTITVTTAEGGYTASCAVTVLQPATSVTLAPAAVQLFAGDSAAITAMVSPANANDQSVNWASSDNAIATVTNGVVTAVNPGSAVITANTANGVSAQATVTVTRRETAVTAQVESLYLQPGQSGTVDIRIAPADTSYTALSWATDNAAVAQVDGWGRITAVAQGVTTVRATTVNGLTTTITVNVVPTGRAVTRVRVSRTAVSIYEGKTYRLRATVTPSRATVRGVRWVSSDSAVATVSSAGVVYGVGKGTAVISAVSSSGLIATSTVTVNEVMPSSIKLNRSSATLYLGSTLQLTATVKPTNTKYRAVTWTSSNSAIAAVSESGLLTPIQAGIVTISARTANGKTRTCRVKVVPVYVKKIVLNARSATLTVGDTMTLAYSYAPLNATSGAVSYTSSKPSVATVTQDGVITAVGNGRAKITCRAADGSRKTATCTVTVKEIRVSALTLNTAAVSVDWQGSCQVTAAIAPANASFRNIVWSSADANVATVAPDGTISGVGAGTTLVTASADNGRIKKQVAVTVTTDSTANYRALIISEFTRSGQKDYLPFAANGTTGVSAALARSSIGGSRYQIKALTSSPSKGQIQTAVSALAAQTQDGDTSIVFVLTHGVVTNGQYEMQISNGNTTISAGEWLSMLSSIKGDVVLVFCTCYSGTMMDSMGTSGGTVMRSLKEAVAAANVTAKGTDGYGKFSLICSAYNTKSSYHNVSSPTQSFDFFTYSLLQGLGWNMLSDEVIPLYADADGDKTVTLSELAQFARTQTVYNISSYLAVQGYGNFVGDSAQTPTSYLTNPTLPLFSRG